MRGVILSVVMLVLAGCTVPASDVDQAAVRTTTPDVVETPSTAEPSATPTTAAPTAAPDFCQPPAEVLAAVLSAGLRDPSHEIRPYAMADLTVTFNPPVYAVAADTYDADGNRVSSADEWVVSNLREDADVLSLTSSAEDFTDFPHADTSFLVDVRTAIAGPGAQDWSITCRALIEDP